MKKLDKQIGEYGRLIFTDIRKRSHSVIGVIEKLHDNCYFIKTKEGKEYPFDPQTIKRMDTFYLKTGNWNVIELDDY